MKTRIDAQVLHEGGWWVAEFTIGNRDFGTQAKRLDQLSEMVKDAAALMTDQSATDFDVNLNVDMGTYETAIDAYSEAAKQAQEVQKQLATASRTAVTQLRAGGFRVKDIATLLGISPQRVSQLSKA